MGKHENNLKKKFRYFHNEIVCSPKRIKYHHPTEKGIRTELKEGKPLECRSCAIAGIHKQQTVYCMETSRGEKMYFCGTHYVRLAEALMAKEKQDAKTGAESVTKLQDQK